MGVGKIKIKSKIVSDYIECPLKPLLSIVYPRYLYCQLSDSPSSAQHNIDKLTSISRSTRRVYFPNTHTIIFTRQAFIRNPKDPSRNASLPRSKDDRIALIQYFHKLCDPTRIDVYRPDREEYTKDDWYSLFSTMCEGWYDDKKGCLDRVDIHGDTISGSIKGLKPLLQGVDHHCHFDHATPAEDEAQSTTPGYLDDSWTTHLPIDHPQNAYPDPDAYFDLDPDQTGMRYSMMIHNLIKPPPSDLSPVLKIYTGATPQTRTRWFITLPKCYDKTRIRWIRINHVINMVIGLVMIRIPEHFDEMVGIRQGEGENAGEGLRWINWVVQ